VIGFLVRLVIAAFGLWLADQLLGGIRIEGNATLLLAALLYGVVNAVVRPVAILLTLPITVVTLGLFLLVVNAAMFGLRAARLDHRRDHGLDRLVVHRAEGALRRAGSAALAAQPRPSSISKRKKGSGTTVSWMPRPLARTWRAERCERRSRITWPITSKEPRGSRSMSFSSVPVGMRFEVSTKIPRAEMSVTMPASLAPL
jgi:putative membrane protein